MIIFIVHPGFFVNLNCSTVNFHDVWIEKKPKAIYVVCDKVFNFQRNMCEITTLIFKGNKNPMWTLECIQFSENNISDKTSSNATVNSLNLLRMAIEHEHV